MVCSCLSSGCRAPTRCSWRWNWMAPSWRAGPSGWRGRWRRRSRRIKVTAKEPRGGPAGAPRRARDGRQEAVGRVSSLRRSSLESSSGQLKAPARSKERWWTQTESWKRKDWRRKGGPTRRSTSDSQLADRQGHEDSFWTRRHPAGSAEMTYVKGEQQSPDQQVVLLFTPTGTVHTVLKPCSVTLHLQLVLLCWIMLSALSVVVLNYRFSL